MPVRADLSENRPVVLGTSPDPDAWPSVPGSVDEALAHVRTWPTDLLPGNGATTRLWELLATCAAADVAVARAVEPHLDALAILSQAGTPDDERPLPTAATWGVYAAEMPGTRLEASRAPDGSWRLDGTKPWCSLADRLGGALVTARVGGGDERGLFAVDLSAPGVVASRQGWVSRGLREIPSGPLELRDVPATLVRSGSWYLDRPGFWWGAIGVAACWYGGAVGVARRVLQHARTRGDDPLLAMHVGAIDERLASARTSLAAAARAVDASGARTDHGRRSEDEDAREAGRVLAKRVRAVVARTCEDVLRSAAHALGPGPLTQEEAYAKRVADLQVYILQQHAERDDVSLGRAVIALPGQPW